jgi:hypothetical protein
VGSRIIGARDRLYDALGASNAAEGEVIRYLIRALPIDAAELLATMAERELRRATAGGYDKGFVEGIEFACEQAETRYTTCDWVTIGPFRRGQP